MNNLDLLNKVIYMTNGVEGYPLAFSNEEGFILEELSKPAQKIINNYFENKINISGVIAQLETLFKKGRKTEKQILELLDREITLCDEVIREEDRIAYKNSSESFGVSFNDIRKTYNTNKLKALDSKHRTLLNRINEAMQSYTLKEWQNMGDLAYRWEWEE